MTRATKQVSGPAVHRFLRRFLAGQPGLEPELADRLAEAASTAVSSLRVRQPAWEQFGPRQRSGTEPAQPSEDAGDDDKDGGEDAPDVPAQTAQPPEPPFDPYAFGLVPVFQREGRDGLARRLDRIASAEHLRTMARAQQIILEASLRAGDAPLEAIRTAILAAVEKRIADRRAAAS